MGRQRDERELILMRQPAYAGNSQNKKYFICHNMKIGNVHNNTSIHKTTSIGKEAKVGS